MAIPGTDPLSPLADQIIKAGRYELLTVSGPAPAEAHRLLDPVSAEQLLAVPVTSPAHAAALLSALWLWHDALDESHHIAQKSPADLNRGSSSISATGSHRLTQLMEGDRKSDPAYIREATSTLAFLHAIMHRREGDFSNSKYWYDRCAGHPVFAALGQHATSTINPLPADKVFLRLLRDGWDPDAFVDFVAEVHRRPSDARFHVAQVLQQIEWQLLFEHCTREAVR